MQQLSGWGEIVNVGGRDDHRAIRLEYLGTPEKARSIAAQLVSVTETRYTGLEQGN